MSLIEWETTDDDIKLVYSGNENAETGSPLPCRFHEFRKYSPDNKWTATVAETVFRFFGDIRSQVEVFSNGGERTRIVPGGHWRNQFFLQVFNDHLGAASTENMPWYLKTIPCKSHNALTRAYGLYRRGRPDKYMLNQSGQPKFDRNRGPDPAMYVVGGAMVTRYVADRNGETKVYEGPALVMLRPWMATQLAEAVDKWRQMRGANWSIVGFPMHIQNVQGKTDTDTILKVNPAGSFHPEDSEEWDMDEYEAPSLAAMVKAIYTGIDDWLVEEGHPIKGFPTPTSHPGGWSSELPLATMQFDNGGVLPEPEKDIVLDPGPGGLEQFDAVEELPTNGRWDSKTDDDLKQLVVEYGIKVGPRGMTRAKMIEKIEAAQRRM